MDKNSEQHPEIDGVIKKTLVPFTINGNAHKFITVFSVWVEVFNYMQVAECTQFSLTCNQSCNSQLYLH